MASAFSIGDRCPADQGVYPSSQKGGGTCGPYVVVGASARGQIHEHRGLDRDDAFAVRGSDCWLAIAVADGVGSKKWSRFGASLAVEAVSGFLAGSPTRGDRAALMREAFADAHQRLLALADKWAIPPDELSCTALALLLDLTSGAAIAAQVGDGAILGWKASGETRELLNAPDTGDVQATYTINGHRYLDHLVVEELPPGESPDAYFLMTDGVSGDVLFSDKPGALDKWAADMHRNVVQSPGPGIAADGLLQWLAGYKVRGSWDDRTLVIVTRAVEEIHNDPEHSSGQPQPSN